MRDRLLLARDLLSPSGSILIQVGDENLHRVRELLDEVFGAENFSALVPFAKTTGLWYAKDVERIEYRPLYELRDAIQSWFSRAELPTGKGCWITPIRPGRAWLRVSPPNRETKGDCPAVFVIDGMKPPRIRPWSNCAFAIQVEVEYDQHNHAKYVRVHLDRRTPTRHGRLRVLHATMPMRKKLDAADAHSMSPSYRLEMLRAALDVLICAGVSGAQAQEMMRQVVEAYPIPLRGDLYAEKLADPLVALALGERRRGLSFFKTGLREWTREDDRLLDACLDDLGRRVRTDKKVRDQVAKLVLGSRAPGR